MSAEHVHGYASRRYERLEDLAENLTYAPIGKRDEALRHYLAALRAVTEERAHVEQGQARERVERIARGQRIETASAAADLRIVKPLPARDRRYRAHATPAA